MQVEKENRYPPYLMAGLPDGLYLVEPSLHGRVYPVLYNQGECLFLGTELTESGFPTDCQIIDAEIKIKKGKVFYMSHGAGEWVELKVGAGQCNIKIIP
jgi:hypothetical protein